MSFICDTCGKHWASESTLAHVCIDAGDIYNEPQHELRCPCGGLVEENDSIHQCERCESWTTLVTGSDLCELCDAVTEAEDGAMSPSTWRIFWAALHTIRNGLDFDGLLKDNLPKRLHPFCDRNAALPEGWKA